MEIFCFSPDGVETLDAFNGRLAAFAAANDITGIVASVLDSALVLSVTVAEDIPAPFLLRPYVVQLLQGVEPQLELALTSVLNGIRAEDGTKGPDDSEIMSMPVEVQALTAIAVVHRQLGFAVFKIVIGDVDIVGGD